MIPVSYTHLDVYKRQPEALQSRHDGNRQSHKQPQASDDQQPTVGKEHLEARRRDAFEQRAQQVVGAEPVDLGLSRRRQPVAQGRQGNGLDIVRGGESPPGDQRPCPRRAGRRIRATRCLLYTSRCV